jgi:catechol 2,3-dioxygenase
MTHDRFKISDTARIGYVNLNVINLSGQRAFYENIIGMNVIKESDRSIWLAPPRDRYNPAVSEAAVVLSATEYSGSRTRRTAGLYHMALLLPGRKELARIFKHILDQGWHFQGFSDHGVSEALYLADPEGNGIELYTDRPRDQWKYVDGRLYMTTDPLDVDDLLSESANGNALDDWNGIAPDTVIGHVHLQVSDLEKAERFYHIILGFDVVQRSYPGALFVSAGGYHHHIGLNVWAGRGIPPAQAGAPGLGSFSVVLSDPENGESIKNRLVEFNIPFREESINNESLLSVTDHDNIQIQILQRQ